MNCPRCGATLYPGYNFCSSCNLPLRVQPQSAQAPYYPPQAPFQNARPAINTPPQPMQVPYYLSQGVAQSAGPGIGSPLSHWPPAQGIGAGDIPQNIPLAQTPQPPAMSGAWTPQEKKRVEKEESENERLMVFSDAVIAFAITVSAIPLKVPKLASLTKLLDSQFSIELALYIFSFFLIYGLWREHHAIFHHIKRNNGWLIALNTMFLAMIVCIPVGFTILLVGFGDSGSRPTQLDSLTIGYGALLYLGAQFCANVLLLLLWWSAHIRPEALFGEEAPEKSFRVYMTLRLLFQVLSFIAYAAVFLLLASSNATLLLVGLGILLLFLGPRWLVLGLYRRRHRQEVDRGLGSENTMRVQLFSDAVFAVAVTITVAQIDPAATASENFSLLGTYVFSFLILGVYWLLHYRVFHAIRRLNRTLVLLNFWFLLLIILAFIPARLYTGDMFDQAHTILFSIYQLIAAGTLFVLWQYAKKHRARAEPGSSLLKEDMTRQQSRRLSWIVSANPCIFLALALITFFTPIPTPLYIAAYFGMLGSMTLIVRLATRAPSLPVAGA